MVHPAADRFVAHSDPKLSEQILKVSQAETEPQIQPDRLTSDLRREAMTDETKLSDTI
jgi:hypothetical protein